MYKYKKGLLCIVLVSANLFTGCSLGRNREYPDYVNSIEINEEFFQSMSDKELIYYKMINSIDFYENASGSYTRFDKESNSNSEVEYYVDIKNKKTYAINNDGMEIIVKDGKRYWIDNTEKTYKESEAIDEKDDKIPKLKIKDRFDGSNIIEREDGIFLDILRDTLFNQSEVAYTLKYLNSWNINKEINYKGRQALEITGDIVSESKTGEKTFYALIDKETGIVLVYKTLDSKNDIVQSLETQRIEIDKGVSDSKFEKDLSQYTNKKC